MKKMEDCKKKKRELFLGTAEIKKINKETDALEKLAKTLVCSRSDKIISGIIAENKEKVEKEKKEQRRKMDALQSIEKAGYECDLELVSHLLNEIDKL